MWLWQDLDHFAFNISERLSGTEDYRGDEQFAPVVEALALSAQTHVLKIRDQFPDLGSVASYLTAAPVSRSGFWELWNAGVAAALVGDVSSARQRFAAVLDEEPFVEWIDDAPQAARQLLTVVQPQ